MKEASQNVDLPESDRMGVTEQAQTPPRKKLHAYRWLLALILLVIVAGAIAVFTFYQPLRDATGRIAVLESEIGQLENEKVRLEGEVTDLQAGLDQASLNLTLLSARTQAMEANQALAAGDYAGARLSLGEVSKKLQALRAILGQQQSDVINAMQRRIDQANTNMSRELKTAKPDIDTLIDNLKKLEDSLASQP